LKIGGWILFVLGILFLLLFAMAAMGGGGMPAIAWIVAGGLALGGWRMKSAARGIAPPAPAAAAPSGAGATAGAPRAAPAGPTVEMPLTPEAAAVIGAARSRSLRVTLVIVGIGLVFFIGLGVIIDSAMSSSPPSPGAFKALPLMAIMAAFFGAMVFGIWLLQNGLPMARDLRSPTYLRTSGPVQLLSMWGGWMVRLADRAFLMKGRTGARELRGVGWAVIDYSPRAHVILAVFDRSGRQVYAAPGYPPAPVTSTS